MLFSANISSDLDLLAETTYYSELYSTEDKELLLGTIAVGKHSSNFWDDFEGVAEIDEKAVKKADRQGYVSGFFRPLEDGYNRREAASLVSCFASMQNYLSQGGPLPN